MNKYVNTVLGKLQLSPKAYALPPKLTYIYDKWHRISFSSNYLILYQTPKNENETNAIKRLYQNLKTRAFFCAEIVFKTSVLKNITRLIG